MKLYTDRTALLTVFLTEGISGSAATPADKSEDERHGLSGSDEPVEWKKTKEGY